MTKLDGGIGSRMKVGSMSSTSAERKIVTNFARIALNDVRQPRSVESCDR